MAKKPVVSGQRRPRSVYFDSRRWSDLPARRRRESGISARGLAKGDIFVPHDEYRTSTGLRVTHAQHYYRGLRVFGSSRVFKKERGKSRATPPLYRLPQGVALDADVTPVEALEAAFAFLQRRGLVAKDVRLSVARESGLAHLVDKPVVIEVRQGLLGSARMHLEVFPRTRRNFEIAWVMDLTLEDERAFQLVVVAAGRPSVRFLTPTNMCAAFTASWFPRPGPVTAPEKFPVPPVATSDGSPGTASAWYDGTGLALGPNVECFAEDQTEYEALGTLPVDNVFVWCNLLHDFFAAFGFDSDHHAFEDDDPLVAIHHTVQKLDPAYFHNWVDGTTPQLNLYESPFGGRPAGEDPSIVIHEYVHGVSSRLVGGSKCQYPFIKPQAHGFSEGLSDYFAITVLNYVDRSRNGLGDVALFGQAFQPLPGGLRDYSNDPGKWSQHLTDPYEIGMVWCAGLRDARRVIAASTHAENATDRFIWQACVDCLKLMAPSCTTSLDLTLADAKKDLVGAMQSLAQLRTKFVAAGAQMKKALGDRNI